MWDFLFPIYGPDFIDRVIYGGTQSSMHTENSIVDNGSKRQIIEDISTVPPDVQRTIFSETFIIEPIDLCDLPAFVVASYQSNHVGIPNFVSKQKQESFHAIEASIDEIPQKEVIYGRNISPIFEELQKIIKLAMYISTYCHRRVNPLDVSFLHQYFLSLCA